MEPIEPLSSRTRTLKAWDADWESWDADGEFEVDAFEVTWFAFMSWLGLVV